MARWSCSCTWEECHRWAQSNGHRLCLQHIPYYKQTQQRINEDVEILASIRSNGDAASAENVHNQINNNDNHHVADDPQPVGVSPDGCQSLLPQPLPMRRPQTLSEQQSAAREEPGVRERESEQRFAARQEPREQEQESEQCARDPVGNVLAEIAENNEQLLDVAVDENIGNQANNNDNGDVMERLLDASAVEYIDDQANNNESLDVVYAPPVGDVPDDIGAVENTKNQEDINNDNQDVVDAPVGNVTDWLFNVTADENIGNGANNEEIHDVVGDPVDHVADIAEVAAVEIIAAAVETIMDVQEHEYEQASVLNIGFTTKPYNTCDMA